jgi:hypothetical protein
METLQISESVKEKLERAEGADLEEKVVGLLRSDLQSRLRVCVEKLYEFEKKHGLKFQEFMELWEKGGIADRYSYETEKDFMEWESLSDEHGLLLSEIRKLREDIKR